MDIRVDIRWHLVMLDPYCSVGADTLTDMRGRIRMRVKFQSEDGDIGQHGPAERRVVSACGSAASAGRGDWNDPRARSRPGRRGSVDPAHSFQAQAAGTRVSRPKPQSNALLAKTRRRIRVL